MYRIFLATEGGVYELIPTGGAHRICCPDLEVVDAALFEGHLYVCSPAHGVYEVKGRQLRRISPGGCWRLVKLGDNLIASLEGPVLVDAVSGAKVADLTGYADELGWRYKRGPAHISDIVLFRDRLVASVEEGNLLAGADLSELRPVKFRGDLHALLSDLGRLFIATSTGVYYTKDLETFNMSRGPTGYTHAVGRCGGYLAVHEVSNKPIWVSVDGITWRNVPVALPPPRHGARSLACLGARALYAVRQVYIIDLARLIIERLASGLPIVLNIEIF